ncbi:MULTISPECIES: alkaline phosphatase [Bacillus]|uniref:Alkaline phosphatase n=1 Tax=Bacillus thuringiensis serovar sooncheon TaxID=180891 RepID=A0A9Q5X5K2_BACTU|nr:MULTISPECIES: alkaline phosphatase [Bacillus]MDC7974936.1 alkaline phosphatase [Bacillus sp. BLCC-B18]OTW71875.1 alkaline phosphatase [Bacillus thuringiensis serovar coreanensis]OTX55495.1 alkaline phosphatase [Bacillus thuringiensis serovar sooncheon]OTX58832.1 alkaline phosphatase [Bacillus thuringiensis serovar guiyangiensis]OTX72536.1 alkaline phosphatase [Bacillus thuringiensis serovar roskildiensis]
MSNLGLLMKKLLLVGTITLSMLCTESMTNDHTVEAKVKKVERQPKNVIIMVMDGTSSSATTLTRLYKGKPLALDEMVTGGVRTYSAESAITDSAPAATALATGNKSNSGYVGVLPSIVSSPGVKPIKEEDKLRPVANVLEGAKRTGRATGIVATAEIQHATPAGFSAHHVNRKRFDVIAEQQVFQHIDVVLGGGKQALLPLKRKDGEDLVKVIQNKGYDFVETKNALLNSKSNKIWGSFSHRALAFDMDREATNPEQPTLSQMTEKAIQTLSKDKDGFFLFVEGSKPDWAAHVNDPIGMISDVLAFDGAVAKALQFAKNDGNTLLIALTDHGNSGISIGNMNTTKGYNTTPISTYIDPLKKAKMTLEGTTNKLKSDLSNVEDIAKLYGLDNLTYDEKERVKEAKKKSDVGPIFTTLLANRANIGFTTGGHTGEDVFLYSFGPKKPYGLIQNTDIAKTMAKAMGFNLEEVTSHLFVESESAFKQNGATVTIDNTTVANPVLIVKRNNVKAQLFVNKNIIRMKNKDYELSSIIVESNGKFYVPEEAIRIFIKHSR